MSDSAALKDKAPRWAKDLANAGTRRYALATVRSRPMPDYLVLGTKRGGTTSLHRYLLMHPDVRGLFPEVRGVKSTDYFFENYSRGDLWYRSHFQGDRARRRHQARTGQRLVGGESSPFYMWDPRIAARVRRSAPHVRGIMLLRDPVTRAWSHYQERLGNGMEPLGFREALDAESERLAGELDLMQADPDFHSVAYDFYSYRARGVYLPQIRNWLTSFPADQLLVLQSEQLYADTQTVFDTVTNFLGLRRFELPDATVFNASGGPRMPEDVREELRAFYKPRNAELESFLGRPLGWDG